MAKCRVILLLPRLTLLVWLLCLQLQLQWQSSVVLVTAATAAAAAAAPQCRLYLAESSVEGAGLGVFSAVSAEEGEQLGHPDLVIPVVDSVHVGGRAGGCAADGTGGGRQWTHGTL
eukprot:scaffold106070_cov58-Attheya_sp.AAC.3